MPVKIDFSSDLDGFGEGKRKQVDMKTVSETDVNFEPPIFTKTREKQWILIDLC